MSENEQALEAIAGALGVNRNEVRHALIGGIAAVAFCMLMIIAAFSVPLAIATAGPVLGLAVEWYQKVRKEGEMSWRDAVATALPFELLAAAWAVSA